MPFSLKEPGKGEKTHVNTEVIEENILCQPNEMKSSIPSGFTEQWWSKAKTNIWKAILKYVSMWMPTGRCNYGAWIALSMCSYVAFFLEGESVGIHQTLSLNVFSVSLYRGWFLLIPSHSFWSRVTSLFSRDGMHCLGGYQGQLNPHKDR